jgi:hypothetical protein
VAAGKCFGPLPVEGKGGVHHDNSVRNNYFYDTSATAEGMPHLRPRADGRAQQNPRCGHLREVRLSDSAEAKSGLTGALVSPRTDQEHCSELDWYFRRDTVYRVVVRSAADLDLQCSKMLPGLSVGTVRDEGHSILCCVGLIS